MTDYVGLIEEHRARHADLMSRVVASDQGPTIFSRTADALARLTAVPANAETTQEERDDATETPGMMGSDFVLRLLRDLARAEAAIIAAVEAETAQWEALFDVLPPIDLPPEVKP